MAMNRLARIVVGGMVVAIGLAVGTAQAAVNLVANGSFETGSFLPEWTPTGNTGFTGVECPGAPFAGPGDGNCDAFFGPVGSIGGITQNLATNIGQRYFISFDFQPDGGTPSSFSATFGGTTLISLNNPPASPYQILNFVATATAATTAIAFNSRDDPGFLKLDSVVVSLSVPATMTFLDICML